MTTFLCLASSGALLAQSTFGSFTGSVRDRAGASIPGCIVALTNTGTSAKRSQLTDDTGSYTFVNVEAGNYDVEFTCDGFRKSTVTGYELLARQTIRSDGNMDLATVSETVNVTAATEPTIQTEVSNVAETKVGRELIDLPLAIASRSSGSTSPISTLTTQPGVQADNNGNISVVGAKPAMISVTLDGISTASAKTNTPITEMFPSFEGIAEIRVSEINNTAEFGGVSDITTISKGGSNAVHGSFFENWQGAALNAKNPFATVKPKLVMNNFGASIGGPLVLPKLYDGHNKTFFFMDYEGLRLPNAETVIRSIPTQAMINGDLSVYSQTIKDPFGGAVFPGKQIPLTRITPLSRNAAALYWPDAPNYGAPGAIANNYSANFPASVTTNQGDLRVDQNIKSNQTAFARLTYKKRAQGNPPSGPVVLGGGATDETYWNLTGAHNTIITPALVNEVRFGISRQENTTLYGYTSQGVASALGLSLPSLPKGAASTNFNINGFSGTSGGTDSLSTSRTVQLLDNITWSKGSHTFKFGGDYRHLSGLYTNVFASGRMSSYTFNNGTLSQAAGVPFAAFLLGTPDQSGLTTVKNPDSFGFASHYAVYAQDNWKITRSLTINYGLRWEYHPNYEDHYLNVANFIPDYTSTVNGQTIKGAVVIPNGQLAQDNLNPDFSASIAPTPVLTAKQAGLPQNLRYSQRTDFGPRIGFAWRATKDGKLVIRGGIGRYIEALSGSGLTAAWAVSSSFVGTYANSMVNGQPRYSFPRPFPTSLALPGTEAFRLASELHYKDPKVDQWNLTIERDLGFNTGLRVTYDGSHGQNLGVTYNANQLRPNTIGVAAASVNAAFPYFNVIQTYGSGARSNYNALTVAVTRRFSKGLQFQGSYAFAKNLSNGNGAAPTGFSGESGGTVTDRFNYNLDYGNVAFTRRHRFQTTFLYAPQFNISNAIAKNIVNGWELSGVVMAQSGAFLTVTTSGADPAGIGANGAYVGGTVRADIVPGVSWIPVNQNPKNWINSAAFSRPANNIGRFGNSSIGSVLGPGTQAVSLSVFRSVKFTEKIQMRLGMAVANALNHANYGNPATQIGVAAFGAITTMQSAEGAGPRQVQLTGRITF